MEKVSRKQIMSEDNRTPYKGFSKAANEQEWPGIDSRYRLIVVAALRSKQLLHGSPSRIEDSLGRRRNTSIALEEVKRGLVSFTTTAVKSKHNGQDDAPLEKERAEKILEPQR
jgi:DNA-directed RNA polymerase omega subunit